MEGQIDNKKCYSCGMTFHTPTDLARHKARKTPCLIRDISEENKKNPLRCIYCNKIFSRLPNLTKHGKTCKIKNGGLETLVDKVKYDEKLRIQKEEHDQEMQKVRDEMNAKITALMEKMEKMEARQIAPPIIANTNNGTINNGTINNIVNIHVNNYTSPSADHLLTFEKFNELFMKEFAGLPVGLACGLYFDQSHPENMSIHLINKSTGEMLAMVEGNWTTKNINEVSERIRAVGYEIAERGIKLHRKKLTFGDADYVCGNILQNVNHPGTEERDLREIREKIVESREITGNAPHIAAKLESTRAVGRVRRGNNVAQIQPIINMPDSNNGDRGDNIA